MFSFDVEKINKASTEELVNWYLEARDISGIAEATRKVVGDRLCELIPDNGKSIGGYLVSKVEKISFPGLEIKEARELGAVITKEVVDLNMLKMLHKRGQKIPKVRISFYPSITNITKEQS